MTTQHTPNDLQHTQKNVVMTECQNSPTNVSTTATHSHMSAGLEVENIKDKSATNALSVEQKTLSETGKQSNWKLLPLTAENAHVAASLIHSFLQSITQEEMVTSIENLGFAGINFINSFVDKDSRKETIDYFVSIVIALAVDSVNAPTRNKPRLIAASPDLLEACIFAKRIMEQLEPITGLKAMIPALSEISNAIAKAQGE